MRTPKASAEKIAASAAYGKDPIAQAIVAHADEARTATVEPVAPLPPPPPIVNRPNARARQNPVVGENMGRVVERVVERASKLWPEYDRLENELSVEGAAAPEQVRQALNRAERNASDSHLLYLAASKEFEIFEHEQTAYQAPLREQATAELQDEKDKGSRSKQITDADVTTRMAKLFPDEVAACIRRRADAEMVVKQFGRLSTLWQQRSYSLSGMISPRRSPL